MAVFRRSYDRFDDSPRSERPRRRGFLVRWAIRLTVLAAVFMLIGVVKANAAPVPTFPDACGSINNFDYAVCERLDYIASEQSTIDSETQDIRQLAGWTVGVLLVLMFAPVIFKLWNVRGL